MLPTLAAIGIWQLVGFNMVLFLAGLSAIPRDLYEAAEIDGCRSGIDRFLTITWPLLGPTTMFVIVTTSITAFKVFDTVAVMTRGGPMGSSEVLLYAIYLEGFQYFHMGYAAALTLIFLAFVAGVLDPADVRPRPPGALLMATHPPAPASPRRDRSRRAARSCGAPLSLVARARHPDRRRGLHPAAVRVDAGHVDQAAGGDLRRRLSACGRSISTAVENYGRALTHGAAAALRAERRHRLRAASCSCRCWSRSRAPTRSPSCAFPAGTALFALVLMGLCIPIQVPALPLYMALAELGLLNTYFSIMMPFFLSVFAIFLFRQFFKSYPGRDHPRGAARRHRANSRSSGASSCRAHGRRSPRSRCSRSSRTGTTCTGR